MIFIRCDVSETIGWGHIKRCLTLSKRLIYHEPVTFLMADYNVGMAKMIENSGCYLFELPTGLSYKEEIAHYPNNCNKIIIDLCHKAVTRDPSQLTQYLHELEKLNFKIIVIDGLGNDSYKTEDAPKIDAYIQPYWGVPRDTKPKSTFWFYGQECVLVDKIYLDVFRYRNPKKIKNIVITFGGSDPQGITITVLKALHQIDEAVNVRCIIGPSFSLKHIEKIKKIQGPAMVDILFSPENLSEHFEWADLGICGSGGSRYEAAATGLPIIFTAISEEYDTLSHLFASFGTAHYIGIYSKLTSRDWANKITELQSAPLDYKKMSDSIQRMRQKEPGGDWLAKKITEVFNYEE